MAAQTAQSTGMGFRSTLRNRYFTRLWLAQIISQTIQNAANFGSIVFLGQQHDHSVTAVGGVIIAFSLPAVIFGVPAGVLVDRLDKRSLLWISNALRALFTFGFVLSIVLSPSNYALIYILTFFISIVGQFFGPAEGAAIPLLVKEGELVSALSLFNITFSLSQAIGFVLLVPLFITGLPLIMGAKAITMVFGNVSLVMVPIDFLFLSIGVLYLVCAGLTWSIPRKELIGTSEPSQTLVGKRISRVWQGVVEAGQYVRRDRRLLTAVLQLTLGGSVLTIIAMIAPIFVTDFYNLPADQAVVVFVPAGVGLVIGSVLMPRIIKRLGLVVSEAAGIIGVAGCVLLLTFSNWVVRMIDPLKWWTNWPYLVIVVILTFCIGLSLDLINLPAQTALQQHSPDWIKGRVLALQMMLLNAASIPIILIVGPAADFLGLAVAMNFMAIAVSVLGLGTVYMTEKAHARTSLHVANPAKLVNDDSANFTGTHSSPLQTSLLGEDARPQRADSARLPAHER